MSFDQQIIDPLSQPLVKCSQIDVENCTEFGFVSNTNQTDELILGVQKQFGFENAVNFTTINKLKAEKPLYGLTFTAGNNKDTLKSLYVYVYVNNYYLKSRLMCDWDQIGKDQVHSYNGVKYCTSNNQPLIMQTKLQHYFAQQKGVYYHPLFKSVPYVQHADSNQNNIAAILLSILALIQFSATYFDIILDKNSGFLEKFRVSGNSDLRYLIFKFLYRSFIFLLQQIIILITVYVGNLTQLVSIHPVELILLMIILNLYATSFGVFVSAFGLIKVSFIVYIIALFGAVLQIGAFSINDEFQAAYSGQIACWLEYLLAPFSIIFGLIFVFINQNLMEFVMDKELMIYTFQQVKILGLNDIFHEVSSSTYSHPAPFVLFIVCLIQAILIFFVGCWLEMKVAVYGSTGNVQIKEIWHLKTLGRAQAKIQKNKTKPINQRKALTQEQIEKCQYEAQIANTEILGQEVNSQQIALICHHLHYTKHKIINNYDDTNEEVLIDDFSCMVEEGQIVRIAGHKQILKIISGNLKMDKAGYQLFKNNKLDSETINQIWMYGMNVRENYITFRQLTSFLTANFILQFQTLTVQKYMEMIASLKKVPQFDQQPGINKVLAVSQLDSFTNIKIHALNDEQKILLSCAGEMLNTNTQILFIDDIWKEMSQHGQMILLDMVKFFIQRCGKEPIIYGSADQMKVKRIKTKKLSVVYLSDQHIEFDLPQTVIERPKQENAVQNLISDLVEETAVSKRKKCNVGWQNWLYLCVAIILGLLALILNFLMPKYENQLIYAVDAKKILNIFSATEEISNQYFDNLDTWERMTANHVEVNGAIVDDYQNQLSTTKNRYLNQFNPPQIQIFDQNQVLGQISLCQNPTQPMSAGSFVEYSVNLTSQDNQTIILKNREFNALQNNGQIGPFQDTQLQNIEGYGWDDKLRPYHSEQTVMRNLNMGRFIKCHPQFEYFQNDQLHQNRTINKNFFEVDFQLKLQNGYDQYFDESDLELYWQTLFKKQSENITKIETNDYKLYSDVVKTLSQSIPNGFISLDNSQSLKLSADALQSGNFSDVYVPLICSFLGVYTNDNPQYYGYQKEIEFVPSQSFKYVESLIQNLSSQELKTYNKMLKLKQNVSIGPTKIPSVFGSTEFELTQSTIHSPIADLNLRMFDAVMKQYDCNILFYLQRLNATNYLMEEISGQSKGTILVFTLVTAFSVLLIKKPKFVKISNPKAIIAFQTAYMLLESVLFTTCTAIFISFSLGAKAALFVNAVAGSSLLVFVLGVLIRQCGMRWFAVLALGLPFVTLESQPLNYILPLNAIYQVFVDGTGFIYLQVVLWAVVDLALAIRKRKTKKVRKSLKLNNSSLEDITTFVLVDPKATRRFFRAE